MRRIVLFLALLVSLLSADGGVEVKAKMVGSEVVVVGSNSNPFSITVAYGASFKNLTPDKGLPLLFVLGPNSSEKVLTLQIDKKDFAFKAHYDWTIGSKDARHDSSYIYRLPYKPGTKEMVSQGFNGKFSHFGDSRYGVDFNMKEGSEVYAAREGTVVRTKSDSNLGGANRAFAKHANEIVIEHSDGTLASYAHLRQNGVLVKVGDKVRRAQLIGYSGKTGYARGAHLHFIVYRALDGKGRESFPVVFKSANGLVKNPKKGLFYQAI